MTASQEIDDIIANTPDWRGKKLAELRDIICKADSSIVEEVKWKKPSRPEGVAVWSSNGNVCIGEMLKNAVRLTFPKGAQINDPYDIFNARMDSSSVRAVDFAEDDVINEAGLTDLILQAIRLNASKLI